MLDTDACIEIIRGRGVGAAQRLASFEPQEVAISVISLAELQCGVEKSAVPERNRLALYDFCAPFSILPFTAQCAAVYGLIRSGLERKGQVIGSMDLLIAAHAVSERRVLVTGKAREFQRVPGLEVVNWLR